MVAFDRLALEAAVRVSVQATQGSAPRGPGTHMLVFARGEEGTIGGGHLEFQALAQARRLLAGELVPTHFRQVLGPSLGQCCGGVVDLAFERVSPAELARLRVPVEKTAGARERAAFELVVRYVAGWEPVSETVSASGPAMEGGR